MYWTRAAFRPLNISPDVEPGDEDAVQGPRFLKEFEKKRREEAATSEEEEVLVEQLPESQNLTSTAQPKSGD